MATPGYRKPTKHTVTHKSTPVRKTSARPKIVKNQEIAPAFSMVEDPAVKLITLMGGYFSEPSFYNNYQPVGSSLDLSQLTGSAKDIAATVYAVLASDRPLDALQIANWARTELNMRTSPQFILAVAATSGRFSGQGWIRNYCPKIIQRPDEVRDVFAMWSMLVGRGASGQKLPAALKRGLSDALAGFRPLTILKHDSDAHPTFADLLSFLDRKRNYPVPQYLRNILVANDWSGPLPRDLALLREFNLATELTQRVRQIAEEISIPWNVISSKFGAASAPAWQRKAVWEMAIPQMGEQALIMNMRNIEQAGVGPDMWELVRKGVASPAVLAKSRLMPYMYMTAMEHVSTREARDILTEAFEDRLRNLAPVAGSTVVIMDTSGSMDQAKLSAQSTTTVKNAAASLAASIFTVDPKNTEIVVFGSSVDLLKLNSRSSAAEVAEMINRDRRGSTYGAKAAAFVRELAYKGKVFDRWIVLSDQQMYEPSGRTSGPSGEFVGFDTEVERYRKEVNPNLKVYAVHVQGYGTAQVNPAGLGNVQMAGFNESIITQIAAMEGTAVAKAEEKASDAPAQVDPHALLELIRANY